MQEEYDVLESQLEENDPVKNNYGELCGESLLETCYTVLPKAIQKKEIISNISSSEQFKISAAESIVHNNEIKKFVNKRREIISRDNSVALQEIGTVPHEEYFPRYCYTFSS